MHAGEALYEDISVSWATSPLRAGRRWLSWHSLGPCVTRTSVIVGASSVAHLESSVATLDNLALGEDQLTAIEKWATED